MANSYFRFKCFTIQQDACAMKVTTDGCLFGAWVAAAMAGLRQKQGKLLDIGTGTGLLPLMVCQKNEVLVDAVEIDEDAARQAGENCRCSPYAKNIQVLQQDVRQLPAAQYDWIISNPPFYERELSSANKAKNRAHHGSGLTWGSLFQIIKEQLSPAGTFYLLLPTKRLAEAEALLQEQGLFIQKRVRIRQSFLHQPFRIIIQGSKIKSSQVDIIELSICTAGKEYTEAFIALLQEYYLYL